ncbi:MAG: TRIC cation channel family protein [Chloroflexota bacterium]
MIIVLFGSLWEDLTWWPLLVSAIDAFGQPAFALLGFQLSILAGIPFLGALFVGLLNGISGGILRDVLVGDVPQFFRPGQLSGGSSLPPCFFMQRCCLLTKLV